MCCGNHPEQRCLLRDGAHAPSVLRIENTSVRTFRDYDEAVEWLTR